MSTNDKDVYADWGVACRTKWQKPSGTVRNRKGGAGDVARELFVPYNHKYVIGAQARPTQPTPRLRALLLGPSRGIVRQRAAFQLDLTQQIIELAA